MVFVNFAEVQATVPFVENSLDVVGIEKETVFLPTEVVQRGVRSEVAVEDSWASVGEVDFLGGVNDFRLV